MGNSREQSALSPSFFLRRHRRESANCLPTRKLNARAASSVEELVSLAGLEASLAESLRNEDVSLELLLRSRPL